MVPPLAAWPAARLPTRSITGNSGFISWAEMSTRPAARRRSATAAQRPPGRCGRSRLASGSSSSSNCGRLIRRDQDPLLLPPDRRPTRSSANACASTASTISCTRGARATMANSEPMPVGLAEPLIGPGSRRACRMGSSRNFLRHVSDVASGSPAVADPHAPRGRLLQTEDDPEQRRLAGLVRADQPGELAGPDLEADVIEHGPPAQMHRHASTSSASPASCVATGSAVTGSRRGHRSVSVEV